MSDEPAVLVVHAVTPFRVKRASKAWLDLWGYTEAELVGIPVLALQGSGTCIRTASLLWAALQVETPLWRPLCVLLSLSARGIDSPLEPTIALVPPRARPVSLTRSLSFWRLQSTPPPPPPAVRSLTPTRPLHLQDGHTCAVRMVCYCKNRLPMIADIEVQPIASPAPNEPRAAQLEFRNVQPQSLRVAPSSGGAGTTADPTAAPTAPPTEAAPSAAPTVIVGGPPDLETDPRFAGKACVLTEANRPWRIVAVSSQWSELTGYSAEEAVGQTCKMLQGPETCETALEALHQACTNHQPLRIRLINVDKERRPFVNTLNLSPVATEGGQTTHIVAAIAREDMPSSLFAGGTPALHAMPRVERSMLPKRQPSSDELGEGIGGFPAEQMLPPADSALAPCNRSPRLAASRGGQLASQIVMRTRSANGRPVSPPPRAKRFCASGRDENGGPCNADIGDEAALKQEQHEHMYEQMAPSTKGSITRPPITDGMALIVAAARGDELPSSVEIGQPSCSTDPHEASVVEDLLKLRSHRMPGIPLGDSRSLSNMSEASDHGAPGGAFSHNRDKPPPFLTKLLQILQTPEYANVVRWSQGEQNAFVVLDTAAFSKTVLPKFFKHNKLSSFVQQLYTYGFRRSNSLSPSDSALSVAFSHDLFRPNRPDLIGMIKRGASGRSSGGGGGGGGGGGALEIRREASSADVSEEAQARNQLNAEVDALEKTIHGLRRSFWEQHRNDTSRLDGLMRQVQARLRANIERQQAQQVGPTKGGAQSSGATSATSPAARLESLISSVSSAARAPASVPTALPPYTTSAASAAAAASIAADAAAQSGSAATRPATLAPPPPKPLAAEPQHAALASATGGAALACREAQAANAGHAAVSRVSRAQIERDDANSATSISQGSSDQQPSMTTAGSSEDTALLAECKEGAHGKFGKYASGGSSDGRSSDGRSSGASSGAPGKPGADDADAEADKTKASEGGSDASGGGSDASGASDERTEAETMLDASRTSSEVTANVSELLGAGGKGSPAGVAAVGAAETIGTRSNGGSSPLQSDNSEAPSTEV